MVNGMREGGVVGFVFLTLNEEGVLNGKLAFEFPLPLGVNRPRRSQSVPFDVLYKWVFSFNFPFTSLSGC